MAKNIDSFVTDNEHNGIDHTGLTGVPAAEVFTSGAHDAVDHTGAPFNLLDAAGHSAINHTGLTGAGRLVQTVFATPVTALVTCNTILPRDDTIPQSSEGTLVISATITPTSLSNTLVFSFESTGSQGNNEQGTVLLFNSGSVNAIAVRDIGYNSPAGGVHCVLNHYQAVASLAATTFDIRIGVDAGALVVNGTSLWSTAASAVFSITEIAP